MVRLQVRVANQKLVFKLDHLYDWSVFVLGLQEV